MLAAVFLLAHLPWLARTLEDIDSVNFALGVSHFDVAAHRPHPPGYPLFIALGKLAAVCLNAVGRGGDGLFQAGARALAIWGAIFGALAAFPLLRFFVALDEPAAGRRRAIAATVITLCAPLLWVTAARPLSDVPGFTAALISQALLAAALARQRALDPGDRERTLESGRLIVLGALAAGVAIGVRSQSALLTVPLLVFVILDRTGRGAAGALLGGALTFAIGVLVWAVPLVVASGGPMGYLLAFSSQAGEDVAGAQMLAVDPSPRRLAFALIQTLVWPWEHVWLAAAVLVLAAIGALVALARNRRGLLVLCVAAGPYALFHLLFQDTAFTRYALPLLPAAAWLAVRGADAVAHGALPLVTATLAASSLLIAVPQAVQYAREGSPLFRALADVAREGAAARPPAVLAMHHPLAVALRGEARPLAGLAGLEAPRRHEWLELVRYWRDGGIAPVWFLADPRRTDLAAIDPRSRRVMQQYRWSFGPGPVMGGMRPTGVDWVAIRAPGWFVAEGWALTPELAGVGGVDGRGPARAAIVAYARRGTIPMRLMIGGRNLGRAGDPDVRFDARVDGRLLATWTAAPAPGFFLSTFMIPAGVLDGPGIYARLEIAAEAADRSRRRVDASVEQFDIQPAHVVMSGFGEGWHEREYDPARGRLWRWTGASSTLQIHHGGRDVTVKIAGESPLRYFDAAPSVTVRAGSEVLRRFAPAADFHTEVRVPADVLDRSEGRLTIDTDRTFVPGERTGSGDKRRLGLRIYDVDVR